MIVKVLISFTRLRDDLLDTFAQNILNKMTGNVNFQTPSPALTDLDIVLKAYQAALAVAISGTKEQTSNKNDKRVALERVLRELAMYVEITSKNNATVALGSGFDIRKPSAPIGILAKPVSIKLETGPNEGSMTVTIERINGADSYLFQYAETPLAPTSAWNTQASTTRSVVINNLSVGKEYAFRIAAVGAHPTLVYSNVLTRFVS